MFSSKSKTKITKITKDIQDTTIKKKHRSPSQKARSAKFFERKAAERKATAKKKKEESGNSMESLLALITTIGLRVEDDLLSFISFYILGDKPLNTKNGECDDDESEEDFQKRDGDAVRKMKSWDWGADDNNYLRIVESVHLADRLLDTALHFVLVPNEQNPPRPT
ncbi:hypothetical protein CNMCM6106_003055 [Aspergillus hiratsukae]|uniref:Uncharacterized protein n=1 Tax=Aspergillus hiratsukae TaxID=1194566 RepID=A0A8H6Q6T2_9EURO|nr:hypothetical protein CNMCM6106_003055 [Aspergillus hiratsukae]